MFERETERELIYEKESDLVNMVLGKTRDQDEDDALPPVHVHFLSQPLAHKTMYTDVMSPLKHIYFSEVYYVENILKVICIGFKHGLTIYNRFNRSLLDSDSLQTVFGNIDVLYSIHQKMRTQLNYVYIALTTEVQHGNSRLRRNHSYTQAEVLAQAIGEIFLNYLPYLKNYKSYVAQLEKGFNVLERKRALSPELDFFIEWTKVCVSLCLCLGSLCLCLSLSLSHIEGEREIMC